MEEIIRKMSLLPKDKLLHSFYGTLLFIIVGYINLELSLLFVFVVAFLREFLNVSGFSFYDLLATVFLPILIYGVLIWNG